MVMRSMLAALLGAGVFFAASCSTPLGTYHCQEDSDCRSEGQSGAICEANDLCSFADPDCGPGGQRYSSSSGKLSNECVGAAEAEPDARPLPLPDASQSVADADTSVPCTAGVTTLSDPGIVDYVVPPGCSSVTIEAFGAGGGGANRGAGNDSGAGGGAGSGAVIVENNFFVLLAAGGGGGGSTDDGDAAILGGGGGGGGHAIATFAITPGTDIAIVIGGGGKHNDLGSLIGGDGGDPGGGNGGVSGKGENAALPWGGGGGSADNTVGGSSTFGGGGGTEEDANGGDSMYGGAGSGGINGIGICGTSTFGGTCSGIAGGGGGFYIDDSGANGSGKLGDAGSSESGGAAAENGPGDGGRGTGAPTNGRNGKVIITPRD